MREASLPSARGRLRWAGLTGLIAALSLCLLPGVADAKRKKKSTVNVMSRNLYLGADLTPALTAPNLPTFLKNAGDIWLQVQRTDFPSRAKSLAQEIRSQNSQIIGLQEAELYRIAIPPDLGAQSIAEVYNFTDLLLGELNRKARSKSQCNRAAKKRKAAGKKPKRCYRGYSLAASKLELDFETPVNDSGAVNNNQSENFGATKDVRITDHDAIIVKNGDVKTSNVTSGTYATNLVASTPAGTLPITRGWVAVDAKVNGGKRFHFVDTHFEAFDSQPSNNSSTGPKPPGGVKLAQAQELIATGLQSSLPVVFVGDTNSQNPPGALVPGEESATLALNAAGFTERAIPAPPFSCCIADANLNDPSGAGIKTRVDHVMSNSARVGLKSGAITSTFANGLWSSDHFGVASALTGLGGKKK